MSAFNTLLLVSLAYVIFLFGIAFAAERRAAQGRGAWLNSPLIYTLSLSVYCTAWTFYGAVGFAARSGLEFLTIYLGPTLIMLAWWVLLRKMVAIGRAERLTSIADLVSSRFGKSTMLGGLVTLLAVIGTTPYIALQLQSVTLSVEVFADAQGAETGQSTALWVAIGLAIFTIIFGTRNLDANERHHGVVMAIAVEAGVKLLALMAVGIFVVWGLGGGAVAVLEKINSSTQGTWNVAPSRWIGLTLLSAAAFLSLPRMFQVMVVENTNDRQLAVASWAFPAYLFAMSLFVLPIAVIGLDRMPIGSNPDLFVLTLPLSEQQTGLATFAFLGGFSSATSMVIVASIAVATMVSNHIVTPIWLRGFGRGATVSGDIRNLILQSRRIAIVAILGLGYLYYQLTGGTAALASIGLIAFVGVSQILPALLGGIFWRAATRQGAAAGLIIGFAIWAYTLFLPSLGQGGIIPAHWFEGGPLGMAFLQPDALFNIEGLDPILHAMLWSLGFNICAFYIVSLWSFPTPVERYQGLRFVDIFNENRSGKGWNSGNVDAEDLLLMVQRILGAEEAQKIFRHAAMKQGGDGPLPVATPEFIEELERDLAGSVGAATAHAMLGQLLGSQSITVEDLMAVADETAQIMEYSTQLEAKSKELTNTARALRLANEKLTALSVQKDSFLSQISHELRTPMTSIRAFAEILQEPGIQPEQSRSYSQIIQAETQRLTRLLDDLLDLSVLENGRVTLNIQDIVLSEIIDRALQSRDTSMPLAIERNPDGENILLRTDPERLAQVIINLVSNAQKYGDASAPTLRIDIEDRGSTLIIDFIDNGDGVAGEHQELIFEKFARVTDQSKAGGAGLGLAICREIMVNLGGGISYLPGQSGGVFRLNIPVEADV